MDAHMAVRTVLVARIGEIVISRERWNAGASAAECPNAVMTFDAQGEDYRTPQKPRIRRPMRKMARLAAFSPHWRMFKGEWPPLVGVALQTSLLIR
jgi:hypothetical protein